MIAFTSIWTQYFRKASWFLFLGLILGLPLMIFSSIQDKMLLSFLWLCCALIGILGVVCNLGQIFIGEGLSKKLVIELRLVFIVVVGLMVWVINASS